MSDDAHSLVGPYVMDALDEDDRAAFEAYMATSPATADEVASLREVTAMLAAGTAETPPEGLRRQIMAEIDTTRQLGPVVTSLHDAQAARATKPEQWAPPTATRFGTFGARVLGIAAAIALVAALGLGAVVAGLNDRLDGLEDTNTQIATLLAADDAVRQQATLPGGGEVTALISPGHATAVTLADGLPDLTEERMYALWGLVDGLPVPIGELVNGRPLVIHAVGLDSVALTVEPRGPLTVPTGSIQLSLEA